MNDFKKKYIEFLAEQVEQEIHYLQQHGHDKNRIYEPCIFCFETTKGMQCIRLKQLREFQTSLQFEKNKYANSASSPKENLKLPSLDLKSLASF